MDPSATREHCCKSCKRTFLLVHVTPRFCVLCGEVFNSAIVRDPIERGGFHVGDRVEAKFSNSVWYPCSILSIRDDGTFAVQHSETQVVREKDVRAIVALPNSPKASPPSTGDRITSPRTSASTPANKPFDRTANVPKPPSLPNSPMPRKRPEVPKPPDVPTNAKPAEPNVVSRTRSNSGASGDNVGGHRRAGSSGGTSSMDAIGKEPASPNQRRKQTLANTINNPGQAGDSVVKSMVQSLALFPSDSECKFDLDLLNSENTNPNARSIRIGVFGDCGVGKSALAHVLIGEQYQSSLPPTVFDTLKSNVDCGKGWKSFPLEIWDVSGSERYTKKRPVIYPNVNAFIVCFDVTDQFSFKNAVKQWLPEIASCCDGLPVILVGTKSDMGKPTVTQEDIDNALRLTAARCAKPLLYVEVSAANSKGVDELHCKAIYSVLFDEKRLSQAKGPGLSAASQLAKLEEQRKLEKANKPPVPPPPVPKAGAKSGGAPGSAPILSSSPARESFTPPLSSSSPTMSFMTTTTTYKSTLPPPMSDFDRAMGSMVVSAPTGFKHIKSATEILAEFDPEYFQRQKRPQALPIAQAQATLRGNKESSDPTSPKAVHNPTPAAVPVAPSTPTIPKSPPVAKIPSPTPTTPVVVKKESIGRSIPPPPAPAQVKWTEATPKYQPLNGGDAVFCRVLKSFVADKEGDISLKVGDIVSMNVQQDFSDDWWFGAVGEADPGYFPQENVCFMREEDVPL